MNKNEKENWRTYMKLCTLPEARRAFSFLWNSTKENVVSLLPLLLTCYTRNMNIRAHIEMLKRVFFPSCSSSTVNRGCLQTNNAIHTNANITI